MNKMQIWRDFKLSLNVEDVLYGEGANPASTGGRRPAIVAAAERALAEGLKLVNPVALVREIKVLEQRHERLLLDGGNVLSGPLVTRHLGGAVRVAAVLCTLGPELEAQTARMFAEEPLYAMALDGLGNAAVEMVGQQVCERIGERVKAEGLQASTPLSPGSPEWPVEDGQPQVLALVETEAAGVQMSSSGMMIPQKSISFVVGIGADMSQAEPCELCSLKEICRYRKS